MAFDTMQAMRSARVVLGEMTMSATLVQAKAELRYADPNSWLLSAATDQLLADSDSALRRETGIIHVAQAGPVKTMDALQKLSSRNRSSPLKFPAAAPSSTAAVACYVSKLRGPSLTLTMPWEHAGPVVRSLCHYWFKKNFASLIIVAREGIEKEAGRAYCEASLYKSNTAIRN